MEVRLDDQQEALRKEPQALIYGKITIHKIM